MIKKTSKILLICLFIFTVAVCVNKPIKYDKAYSGAFGFSNETNNQVQAPPVKNIYIFNNQKEWSEFANKHLNKLQIPNLNFNDKKVIYVQIDWPEPLSGSAYAISSISADNGKLNVTVKKEDAQIFVSSNEGIFFKYIIIATIDNSSVPNNSITNLIIKNKNM